MAQVRVPVLPPNLPGIPQAGYGTPGINPNAPDPRTGRPPQSDLEAWIDRFLKGITIFGPGGVFATPAPGQTQEATQRAEEAVRSDRQAQGEDKPGPPWCFGLEETICSGAGLAKGACTFTARLVCLGIGVIVLLALLGIGLHAVVS
jgi:hypothetical protein